jgi:Putative prokaryotic signal transducing protein
MIEVAWFDTRTRAELARALLAAAGIPCVLDPGQPTGGDPGRRPGGARLLVAEADARDAAQILMDRGPTDDERG